MQQALPTVEGLSPMIIWYTFAGIVGIMALIVLYGKVEAFFIGRRQRSEEKKARADGTIQGQLDRINKKLDSIDEYIRESNERFERDNRRINALEKQSGDTNKGIKALAKASLAHLQHDITGNHVETLKEAESMITDYLTER